MSFFRLVFFILLAGFAVASHAEQSIQERFLACLEALQAENTQFEGGEAEMTDRVVARVLKVLEEIKPDFVIPGFSDDTQADADIDKAYPVIVKLKKVLEQLETASKDDRGKRLAELETLSAKLVPIMVDGNTRNLDALVAILERKCSKLNRRVTDKVSDVVIEAKQQIETNRKVSQIAENEVASQIGPRLLYSGREGTKEAFPKEAIKARFRLQGYLSAKISAARKKLESSKQNKGLNPPAVKLNGSH